MTTPATQTIRLPSSRELDAGQIELLKSLQAGEKIVAVQTVRVGARVWTTEVQGTFRGINYLSTGITTDRVPEDDIIVPTVHFLKTNGELASIAIDENTRLRRA
ncbi:MAG: hypothetical protein ACRCZF_19400 [Gemmataceae bacterium]